LDLSAHHSQWSNVLEAIQAEQQPYLTYLRTFHQTRSNAAVTGAEEGEAKRDKLLQSKAYKQYARDLAAYLVDFHRRIEPLVSVSHLLLQEALRHTGSTTASHGDRGAGTAPSTSALLHLAAVESPAALAELGPLAIKRQLAVRGLKCGGTPVQRAERLWAVRGMDVQQIPAKHRAKNFPAAQEALQLLAASAVASAPTAPHGITANSGSLEDGASAAAENDSSDDGSDASGSGGVEGVEGADDSTDVFAVPAELSVSMPHEDRFAAGTAMTLWHERVVRFMCGALSTVLSATIARAQRRQTRTWEELRADKEAEAAAETEGGAMVGQGAAGAGDESDSDEEGPIYNPKKVPLDWDGKPIPYWMYKLHGLRFSFPCEVCGDITYQGPKVGQAHFSRAEHAAGMRRLGVPNSAHFHGLSKIADVLALWGKVAQELKTSQWDANTQEEFEDSAGNVMNRRTYEDLARQGLL
jgi:splicing factor 3A subunit 3